MQRNENLPFNYIFQSESRLSTISVIIRRRKKHTSEHFQDNRRHTIRDMTSSVRSIPALAYTEGEVLGEKINEEMIYPKAPHSSRRRLCSVRNGEIGQEHAISRRSSRFSPRPDGTTFQGHRATCFRSTLPSKADPDKIEL